MNVLAQTLNVASGQTLSANDLNVDAIGMSLILNDNGTMSAVSSLFIGSKIAPGPGDIITMQGSPQQPLSVTADGGALLVWSDGDLDIDSSYAFSASGSGSSITFIAGNLNINAGTTYTTGSNGQVLLSATTINNTASAAVTGGTFSIECSTLNNSGVISDATEPITISTGNFANNGTVSYTGAATSTQTIIVYSSGSLTLSAGNGSTTGLFNAGDASNSLVIDPTTLYLPNGTNQSTTGILVIDADRIQGDNGGTATLSATAQIQVAPYSTSTVTFGVPTAGTDTTTINLNSPSVQVTASNVALEQTVTLQSTGSFALATSSLTNNGLIMVTGTNGITVNAGASALTVSGSGSMSASANGLITLNGASVSATQGSFARPVGGSATNGDFAVTASGGNLKYCQYNKHQRLYLF